MSADAAPSASGPTAERPPIPRRAWYALALAASSYVVILDSIGVSVAFAGIEDAFPDTARTTLAWVSTGFSIALAALLLLGGRLADNYGRRRVFLSGAGIYLLGAIIATVAPNPAVLIPARVLGGCGGALMTATAIALALPEFPAVHRGLAIGWLGAGGALAAVLGPMMGAVVVEVAGWRGAFAMTIPFCVLMLFFGARLLTESSVTAGDAPLDLVSVAVGTIAVASFTLALIQGGSWGWTSPPILIAFAASAVLLPLFVRRSARSEAPLLAVSAFADRRFSVGTLAQLGSQLGIFAWFFGTPLFLQNIWGWSAVDAGWALALAMLGGFISIPAGRLVDRRGYRSILVVGGIITAAGPAWWLLMLDATPDLWVGLVPGLVVFGLGAGIVGVPGTGAALVSIADEDLAPANAAHQTTRRLIQALGIAVAVAVLGSRTNDSVTSFKWVWAVTVAGYLFGSVVIAVAYPADERTAGGTS